MRIILGSMDIMDERRIAIQPIQRRWYAGCVNALDILRLDLLHPIISGNKWYKLRFNLKLAITQGCKGLLTFGGGHSNHLAATAYAGKINGLATIGIVRGNYPIPTPTLNQCEQWGMQLISIPAPEYERKNDALWLQELTNRYPSHFMIPEGGHNEMGIEGVSTIAGLIPTTYTHVAVSVGTGTTLIGLRRALPAAQHIIGFAPMKQGRYLTTSVENMLAAPHNHKWTLTDDFHLGGFGKWNGQLIDFMNDFYVEHGVPLDVVYTSKMMFGIRELMFGGYFAQSDRILCLHTGGLQGNMHLGKQLIWQEKC